MDPCTDGDVMRIAGFTRINTQIRPGAELAVVHLDDGEEDSITADELREVISTIRESISGIAVDSFGSDPLSYPGLYKLLKGLAVKGVEMMLSTEGSDHHNLDDLVGAGYIDSINLLLDAPITDSQLECIQVMRDNGSRYMVTILVTKGVFNVDSMSRIVGSIHDSQHVIIRNSRGFGALDRKDMVELTKPFKGAVKDLRIIQ